MDLEEVEIVPISVEELRADKSGVLVEQMAALAYQAFRDPPWSDQTEKPRLHLGLGGAMRALFTNLGFQELSVHDTSYPERTYWLLRL